MHYVLEEVDFGGVYWRVVDWLATTTETYSIKGEIVVYRVGGKQKRERSHVFALEKSNRNRSSADIARVIYI